jgi:metal-sulfur cluster biosynthetic enzyme
MRPTIAAPSAENLKNTILEDMMPANDPDQPRDIIDLGSVRRLPSTGFRIRT